jgi:cytochrome c oxidase subunit 3
MATTIHPPATDIPRNAARPNGSRTEDTAGNGGWRNLVPEDGDQRVVNEYSPPPASTGVWVFVAGVCMTFAALTSALVVRKGGDLYWRHFTLPSLLYLNTLVLVASSVTLEISRRHVGSFMGGVKTTATKPARWLYATLSLGILFLAGQYLAWRQLSAQGLYLATNPSSSFFYVFTAAHAVHLLGGLYALTRVIRKLKHRVLRRVTLDATAHYWHFMDVLWIYLLALLWMKL